MHFRLLFHTCMWPERTEVTERGDKASRALAEIGANRIKNHMSNFSLPPLTTVNHTRLIDVDSMLFLGSEI